MAGDIVQTRLLLASDDALKPLEGQSRVPRSPCHPRLVRTVVTVTSQIDQRKYQHWDPPMNWDHHTHELVGFSALASLLFVSIGHKITAINWDEQGRNMMCFEMFVSGNQYIFSLHQKINIPDSETSSHVLTSRWILLTRDVSFINSKTNKSSGHSSIISWSLGWLCAITEVSCAAL